jgi:transcription elongation regulator 1
LPLEERIKQFKDLLIEKDVSAYSTWEKELQKIVFDPRYLLLTSKERKTVFDKYVRDRANQEKEEKAEQLKKKRDAFRQLLKEANLNSKSTFVEFSTTARFARDERFKSIEKMKDRESLFNDFLADLKRNTESKSKSNSASASNINNNNNNTSSSSLLSKEELKKNYMIMFKELKSLHRYSSWTETKRSIENDSRYKAIESSKKREDYFRDYCKTLDRPSSSNSSTTNESSQKSSSSKKSHKSKKDKKIDKERRGDEKEEGETSSDDEFDDNDAESDQNERNEK